MKLSAAQLSVMVVSGLGVQVDEAAWREFQKLKEQLDQEKRDTALLTAAFIDHRAQTAADSLVCILLPVCDQCVTGVLPVCSQCVTSM